MAAPRTGFSGLDSMQKSGIGLLGGSLAGGIGAQLFGGNPKFKNPANAADPFLQNIPGILQQYLAPYMQQGQQMSPQLQEMYKKLSLNPGQQLSEIGAGYKESPGYQFRLNQALQAGNNAAAAGGMLGSQEHQLKNMGIASNLASEDYENYLNHALGLFGTGLQGEQGFQKQGFDASSELGNSIAQALMSRAGLHYQGANQQNQYEQAKAQSRGNLFGELGGLGGLLSSFFL